MDNPRQAAGRTRGWALPLKADSIFRVVPPLSADRTVSRVTSSLWKERGLNADGFPRNKGQDPDPHSPWRRERLTNAGLPSKGPSSSNSKNSPSLVRRKPAQLIPFSQFALRCDASRLRRHGGEGLCARAGDCFLFRSPARAREVGALKRVFGKKKKKEGVWGGRRGRAQARLSFREPARPPASPASVRPCSASVLLLESGPLPRRKQLLCLFLRILLFRLEIWD